MLQWIDTGTKTNKYIIWVSALLIPKCVILALQSIMCYTTSSPFFWKPVSSHGSCNSIYIDIGGTSDQYIPPFIILNEMFASAGMTCPTKSLTIFKNRLKHTSSIFIWASNSNSQFNSNELYWHDLPSIVKALSIRVVRLIEIESQSRFETLRFTNGKACDVDTILLRSRAYAWVAVLLTNRVSAPPSPQSALL